LRWAAPAIVFAMAAGCGQPTSPPPKGTPSTASTTTAATADNLVTLHVEGMV
jgi:hypothetical protein